MKINLFPIDSPPNRNGILHEEIAQIMAQFAHDTGAKKTYDIRAGQAALDVMRVFQKYLDELDTTKQG